MLPFKLGHGAHRFVQFAMVVPTIQLFIAIGKATFWGGVQNFGQSHINIKTEIIFDNTESAKCFVSFLLALAAARSLFIHKKMWSSSVIISRCWDVHPNLPHWLG